VKNDTDRVVDLPEVRQMRPTPMVLVELLMRLGIRRRQADGDRAAPRRGPRCTELRDHR